MDWGADRKVLRLYRTLVRSKLDYGCIVYCSARQSYLRKLDSIHNQGLRLALGAFRTSPINSLYAEANEPSLNLRRKKLCMQYYLKLKSNQNNPTHKAVFEPLHKDEFLKREKVIPPFKLRCEADISCLDCDLEDVANYKISEVPLWSSKSPTYLYNLASDQKAITDPIVFKTKFLEIKEQYYTNEEIYTDGSKDGKKLLQLPSLMANYISSGYLITLLFSLQNLRRLTLLSAILNKTPTGDTSYSLILYQLCKRLRVRKQIIHL